MDGLVIWASYPPNRADLSDLAIPVVSIDGSRELWVNNTNVGERKSLLPEDTRYVRISISVLLWTLPKSLTFCVRISKTC
jgi:hypothetical protein